MAAGFDMNNVERALELFSRQCNCAQAVLAAYGPGEGLEESQCLRLAAPLGGGIGRTGETCGVVSAAVLVLGLRYGAEAATDPKAKAALYERVRDLLGRFKARHGSTLCRELLGCDISTPEGWREIQDRKLHQTLCPGLVRSAGEILDETR